MKKTKCIQLVLITAALAGCDRPLYVQGGATYDPGYESDSTRSCPLASSDLPPDYYLWYEGLQPDDFYAGDGFNLWGYYAYRFSATILRAGFGRAHAHAHS